MIARVAEALDGGIIGPARIRGRAGSEWDVVVKQNGAGAAMAMPHRIWAHEVSSSRNTEQGVRAEHSGPAISCCLKCKYSESHGAV